MDDAEKVPTRSYYPYSCSSSTLDSDRTPEHVRDEGCFPLLNLHGGATSTCRKGGPTGSRIVSVLVKRAKGDAMYYDKREHWTACHVCLEGQPVSVVAGCSTQCVQSRMLSLTSYFPRLVRRCFSLFTTTTTAIHLPRLLDHGEYDYYYNLELGRTSLISMVQFPRSTSW